MLKCLETLTLNSLLLVIIVAIEFIHECSHGAQVSIIGEEPRTDIPILRLGREIHSETNLLLPQCVLTHIAAHKVYRIYVVYS